MTKQDKVLDFYRRQRGMSEPGAYSALYEPLPADAASLAVEVQGLILHLHVAPAYGVTLSPERQDEAHLRSVERILDRILAHDRRPLCETRSLDNRVIGTCRDFTLVLTSMLRAKGVPARARCGFGTYFQAGQFVDHWVCEHWTAAESRWVRTDAQLDAVQRDLFMPDFDVLDVPHDRFLIAGDAWAKCRSGALNPEQFGIMDMRGLWFVAGNVVRDFAALNAVEMLPWDVWGAMAGPDANFEDPHLLAMVDRLATLTQTPDAHFDEIRSMYESDPGLRVPATVFNAVRQRTEAV
ncbi:transglutaminase [bacterium SCGC AG-212-C10]|nr:transglutaminase [bacterium SCGC AG-212-C10]